MEIKNNGTIIKVYPSDESELTIGVMTSGKVVLHFRSDQDIKLEQGATIEFLGNTYTLIYPQETKKLWRGYFEYIATFYSSAEQLKHKLLKDPSNIARTSFVFAGSPTDFATLIARSMGREWSVGNCIATSYDKTIAFKEESCWAALGRVAEEFHTEWVIEGKSISLRKDERYKEDPLPLSYGKGNGFLSGVSQRGNADNLPISRLYVLGSSRNIDPTKYGASTLHLPKSWSGEGMRTDEAGNYIELVEGNGVEGAMELTDLYPHRVGVVSSVVVANEAKHFYDIIDTSIPDELNYNDYRIRGEKAILKFETGVLAGRQFEIRQSETALSGYHHQERRFELIPSEQDGFIMPSKEWSPKAGDKYAIFGIALPQEYVTRSENELLKEAIRTLSERSLPQFTFEGEVDGIWAKQKWLEIGGKLVPGGHVLFSDPEFHPEGTVIRITSMAQKVNNPTAPSITLSTALVGGSLWNVLNRAEAQEVLSQKRDRELQRSQRQSYEQALEHIGMVERAVEGVEGFSKRIKPSVIETMGLLVGSQATQLDFVERYGSLKSVPMAINYNPTDKRVTISNAFIRHQTIGITNITNARKPTDYRYWSVARYTSPALTDMEQSYYIYAKVEREGKGGNYLLSPDPLPFETTTHYHLLIGTLSSVIDGDRAYNRLYGFSMVTPGQILTDTISSANGNMTIDLQNGSIISDQIEFRRPDGSTKEVGTYIGEIEESLKGLVQKVDLEFAVNKSEVAAPLMDDTSWQTDAPTTLEVGDCLWQRQKATMADGSTTYSGVRCVYVAGSNGAVEMRLYAKKIDVEFAVSDSSEVVPMNGWVTLAPTPLKIGQFLWYRTAVEWADGSQTTAGVGVIKGGKESVGVKSISIEWAEGSKDTAPTAGWQATPVTPQDGNHLWMRVVTELTTGEKSVVNCGSVTDSVVVEAREPKSVSVEYAPSDSVEAPTSGWTSKAPLDGGAKYVHARAVTELTNGERELYDLGSAELTRTAKVSPKIVKFRYQYSLGWNQWKDCPVDREGYCRYSYISGRRAGFKVRAIVYFAGGSERIMDEFTFNFSGVYFSSLYLFFDAAHKDAGYPLQQEEAGSVEGRVKPGQLYGDGKPKSDGSFPKDDELALGFFVALKNNNGDTIKAYYGGFQTVSVPPPTTQTQTLSHLRPYFKLTSQKATPTDGGWLQTAPQWSTGKFIYAKMCYGYSTSDDYTYTEAKLVTAGEYRGAVNRSLATKGVEYYLSTSKTAQEGGTWQAEQPSWVDGKFIFARVKASYSDGTATQTTPTLVTDSYEASYSSVVSAVEEYYDSESDKALKGGSWVQTAPAIRKERHIYTRVLAELSDHTKQQSEAVCANPSRNVNPNGGGNSGGSGGDGSGIKSIQELYYLSTSYTELVGGQWLDEAPIANKGQYIWTRLLFIYTSGLKYFTDPVCATGIDGKDAVPPRIGANGNWEFWDGTKWVDSGRTSKGDDGHAPKIVNGYWWEWDASKGEYTNTNIKAEGHDGQDAVPPRIADNGNWEFWDGTKWVDSGRTSKGDDGHAPKIVDGYWWEWDASKGKYTNANIRAEGRPGKDAGKYLGEAEMLDPGRSSNFKRDGQWYSADVGNFVYLTQDASSYNTYYEGEQFYRLTSGYRWELYPIKGKEGKPGKNGEGADPKEMEQIRAGISKATTLIDSLKKAQQKLDAGLLSKADMRDIQYLLDSLKNGKTQVAGGLVLTNDIILSEPTTGQVMATISGTANTGANALRLGIQYPDSVALATLLDSGKVSFGSDITTDEQREQSLLKQGYSVVYKFPNIRNWIVRSTASTGELTTLRNDGTGHIGQLHFDSDRIVVAPIGDISKAFMEFGRNVMRQTIQEVLQANAINSSTTLPDVRVVRRQEYPHTFEVLNDNTSVTIDMDLVIYPGKRDRYESGFMAVRLDRERSMSNRVFVEGFSGGPDNKTKSIHKTVILGKGTYVLTFYTNYLEGGANNIKVHQKYSTNYRQTSFSDRGMRIYGGGGNSFVDFNHDHPQGTTFATIGGGLKVDYIDTPGVPLCGVMVRSSGAIVKSFGRYKNKWGTGQPQVDYDYSTKRYTVHHSIPHDHYIPTIQVTGYSGNNGSWSLAPRVFNISSYSFEVAIITNGDNYTQNGFSYTCFLAE